MSLVLLEKHKNLAILTLNNPEKLNAMDWEMAETMEARVEEINADSKVRTVILTGSGKAFCAGGNLEFILNRTKRSAAENEQEMLTFYSKFLAIRHLKVPSIGMINGPAVGAGFCLALCADLRMANSEARLGANFAKLGLSSGMGGLYLLNRLTGPAVAADLFFTGRLIPAKEALELGIVNSVHSPESLKQAVFEKAEAIAQNAPLPLEIMKKGLQRVTTATLEEIFDYESKGQALCFPTEDLKEGIRAIQEKRSPIFSGH